MLPLFVLMIAVVGIRASFHAEPADANADRSFAMKIVEARGLEPLTSALQRQRSTS
jgi:hypothetical protein